MPNPIEASERGVIISDRLSKVVGTYFILTQQLGFHTEDKDFKQLLHEIHRDRILYTDGDVVKRRSLHNVPLNTAKAVFASHGFRLLTQAEFDSFSRDDQNPATPPVQEEREDAYWRGIKHYIFRRSDNTSVGMLWLRPSGTIFDSIEDPQLQELVTPSDKLVSLSVPDTEESKGFIAQRSLELPLTRLSIYDLEQYLYPNYYVVPAGYVENTRDWVESPPQVSH